MKASSNVLLPDPSSCKTRSIKADAGMRVSQLLHGSTGVGDNHQLVVKGMESTE